MEYREREPNDEVIRQLIRFSEDWEKENSCYGYRKNDESDIVGNRVFLAENDGKRVGYLFGKNCASMNNGPIMPDGTRYFEVEELYVVPEFRSKGIGRSLFLYVEGQVGKEGVEYVMLSTATRNYRAILHFYVDELEMNVWNMRLFKKIS